MFSASPVVHHINGMQNYRAVMCLIALTGELMIFRVEIHLDREGFSV